MFGLLLLQLLFVGAILTTKEVPGGHGKPHAKYQVMQQSAAGSVRHHPRVLWLGCALGVTSILFCVGCLAWGLQAGDGAQSVDEGQTAEQAKAGKKAAYKWPLIAGAVLYVALFLALIISYRSYAAGELQATFLAFPLPTAIMLYLIWPLPVIFVVLYIAEFDRVVLSAEKLKRFEQLVASHRQTEEGSD